MKKITQKTDFWPILSILFIVIALAVLNFIPGTWFTGWDNLHPEFNWGLNLQRSLFPAWQEQQGLGLSAIQSHGADLPRQLVLFILGLVVPAMQLRYVWTFLSLLAGGIGIYYLVKNILQVNHHKHESLQEKKKPQFIAITGFASALFYILNLSTITQYFLAFEMFVVLHSVLPWAILLGWKYSREHSYRILFWFAILNLYGAAMAYAASLWIVYAFFLALILGILAISKIKDWKILLRALLLGLVLILTNLFWLVPTLWDLESKSETVLSFRPNQISSYETYDKNKASSSLNNVLLHKNYFLEESDFDEDNRVVPLMQAWQEAEENPIYNIGKYFLLSISIIGLVWAISNKYQLTFPLLITGGLTIFILIGENPPIGFIMEFIRSQSDFLAELFRNPFTKFSIHWAFVNAIFFGLGTKALLDISQKYLKTNFQIIQLVTLLFTFLIVFLPAFQGNYIYPRLQVEIPEYYFEYFDWTEQQDENRRIAYMPVNSIWGWHNYDWGYRGSGFMWFGTPQPTMDRAFDVWSQENSSYYDQMSTAYFMNDHELYSNVLQKYQIHFVVNDKSKKILNVKDQQIERENIENFLDSVNGLEKIESIGEIDIYKVILKEDQQIELTNIAGDNQSRIDQKFANHKDYIFDENKEFQYIFPFNEEDIKNFKLIDEEIVIESEINLNEDKSFNLKKLQNTNFDKLLINGAEVTDINSEILLKKGSNKFSLSFNYLNNTQKLIPQIESGEVNTCKGNSTIKKTNTSIEYSITEDSVLCDRVSFESGMPSQGVWEFNLSNENKLEGSIHFIDQEKNERVFWTDKLYADKEKSNRYLHLVRDETSDIEIIFQIPNRSSNSSEVKIQNANFYELPIEEILEISLENSTSTAKINAKNNTNFIQIGNISLEQGNSIIWQSSDNNFVNESSIKVNQWASFQIIEKDNYIIMFLPEIFTLVATLVSFYTVYILFLSRILLNNFVTKIL